MGFASRSVCGRRTETFRGNWSAYSERRVVGLRGNGGGMILSTGSTVPSYRNSTPSLRRHRPRRHRLRSHLLHQHQSQSQHQLKYLNLLQHQLQRQSQHPHQHQSKHQHQHQHLHQSQHPHLNLSQHPLQHLHPHQLQHRSQHQHQHQHQHRHQLQHQHQHPLHLSRRLRRHLQGAVAKAAVARCLAWSQGWEGVPQRRARPHTAKRRRCEAGTCTAISSRRACPCSCPPTAAASQCL